jgi:hypothetical protein
MGIAGPIFSWEFPWRSPDLARFTRTAQFRELQSAAASWIELQFARIQDETTWLAPASKMVSDYCIISGIRFRRSWTIGMIRRHMVDPTPIRSIAGHGVQGSCGVDHAHPAGPYRPGPGFPASA